MGVMKHWLKGQPFARYGTRTIDRETLHDLLGVVIYEADRASTLEDAGFTDDTPAVDCLFDYVLDALGIPPETESFSREPFARLFYNDFWLEKRYGSVPEALDALEVLRDDITERAAKAAAARARIRVVEPDGPRTQ